jgi:hypothetical protein
MHSIRMPPPFEAILHSNTLAFERNPFHAEQRFFDSQQDFLYVETILRQKCNCRPPTFCAIVDTSTFCAIVGAPT